MYPLGSQALLLFLFCALEKSPVFLSKAETRAKFSIFHQIFSFCSRRFLWVKAQLMGTPLTAPRLFIIISLLIGFALFEFASLEIWQFRQSFLLRSILMKKDSHYWQNEDDIMDNFLRKLHFCALKKGEKSMQQRPLSLFFFAAFFLGKYCRSLFTSIWN